MSKHNRRLLASSVAPAISLERDIRKRRRPRKPARDERSVERVRAGQQLSRAEIRRRLWHMLPGLLPFALPAVIEHDPLHWTSVCLISALGMVITVALLVMYRSIARIGEEHFVFNAVSYPASVLGTLVLFPGQPELAATVLSVLAFGDGSATLFGLMFGTRRLPWNPEKTWVGTISFLVCAVPMATLAYWHVARPVVPLATAALVAGSAATLGAVAESLRTRLTDNLRVGVAAAAGAILIRLLYLGWS